jgi:AraC-like DNA-binding protein
MRSLCQVLCITPRTLQRRLEAENITFREVVEEIKKQISSLLLMHEDYSVSAISFVLGYAEPASFIHSFKKWFGHPPESLRQRLKSH